ncbi:hypothetical protein AMK34_13080 [Amycolatopsis sp. CB00013]|nr:hypothetical protein AMK34_13080 [Amycolatopsis sp. CB00013]
MLEQYAERLAGEPAQELTPVPLKQTIEGFQVDLYMRSNHSEGLLPFVREYLLNPDGDDRRFHVRGVDACLFIATKSSLYAVTSGGGFRVIADAVDYSFPFDSAKKLISNSFTATDVRDMIGSRTSRSETYRRAYSIDKSEAVDTVWKKLVGRLDAGQLPEGSPLIGLIDPDKPPALEIKSSFVLRQKLDLVEITKLITALEALPEPDEERLRQLSFLDNLYPVRNDKGLEGDLTRAFVENIRKSLANGEVPDIDVLDPYDIVAFNAGSDFRLSRANLGQSAPDFVDLVPQITRKLKDSLDDTSVFVEKFLTLSLSYRIDPDDRSKKIYRKLVDFLHGQVDLDGQTFFRIDKVWYRSLGDFLENLKNDFIEEVFNAEEPILLDSELSFLPWASGSESEFNSLQADEDDFYFGDEIFANANRGDIELFDLLKVDKESKRLYIIQTKSGFGNSMRDACSQILVASDVIEADLRDERKLLTRYYSEKWRKDDHNKKVTLRSFLSWFSYTRTYVVLCSTKQQFIPEDFEKRRLYSHIARREILATKNEMKRNQRQFRLAHTKSEKKPTGS